MVAGVSPARRTTRWSTRRRGLQGSNTDFLLCAIAHRLRMPMLTTDDDFPRYAKVIPLALYPRQL